MCQFKHWFFDESGYVVQCEKCDYFQVSFGTTILTLDTNNYKTFVELVTVKKHNHISMNNPNTKCIIMPTPCSSINTILSEAELDTLYHMLCEADTEMQTQQLISLFNPAS